MVECYRIQTYLTDRYTIVLFETGWERSRASTRRSPHSRHMVDHNRMCSHRSKLGSARHARNIPHTPPADPQSNLHSTCRSRNTHHSQTPGTLGRYKRQGWNERSLRLGIHKRLGTEAVERWSKLRQMLAMNYKQILYGFQPYYIKRILWLTFGRAELKQAALLGRIAHRIVHQVKLV